MAAQFYLMRFHQSIMKMSSGCNKRELADLCKNFLAFIIELQNSDGKDSLWHNSNHKIGRKCLVWGEGRSGKSEYPQVIEFLIDISIAFLDLQAKFNIHKNKFQICKDQDCIPPSLPPPRQKLIISVSLQRHPIQHVSFNNIRKERGKKEKEKATVTFGCQSLQAQNLYHGCIIYKTENWIKNKH